MRFPFFSSSQEEAKWERVPVSDADVRFPSFKEGFNRRWIGTNIESVYLVSNPLGVCGALDDAVSRYSAGTIRILSGGHCYEDFVFNENTKAIINVTGLIEYGKDSSRGYYCSSGDTNWGSFKKLFTDHGKVIPGGSCYSVGLGGHIAGGGDGILSRLHGLTVDWLTGVEVVVKPDVNRPSEVKYVSRNSLFEDERNLFWAHTGGGGGNFGIITKFYFEDLPNSPKGAVATNVYFSWDDLTEETLSEILDYYFNLAFSTDRNTVGKFPIFHRGAGQFTMYIYTAYHSYDEKRAAKKLHYKIETELDSIIKIREPLRPLGSHGGWMPFPLRPRKNHSSLQEYEDSEEMVYPFYPMVQTMNGSGPNQRGKYKSAYMIKKLPAYQITTLFKYLSETPEGLTDSDMTESMVQFDIFGGKIRDVAPDYTAIAQRSYYVKMQYQTYWQYAADDEKHIGWMKSFYDEMYEPYGGVPNPDFRDEEGEAVFEGCYYNYPDIDLNDWQNDRYGALYLYFIGNLDKLISVKKRWDPTDLFRHKQSIPTMTLDEAKKKEGSIIPAKS